MTDSPYFIFHKVARGIWVALMIAAAFSAFKLCAGEDADFQKAKGFYTFQEYPLAIEALAKFVGTYPKSDRLEDVKLLIAESHFQLKSYPDAAREYEAFLAAYPKSARRADALQREIMAFAIAKDYAKCLQYAKSFIEENREKWKAAPAQDPIQIKFATALYRAGDSSYELKDFAGAQRFWEELTDNMPASRLAADANEGLGWIYFNDKKFDKSGAAFHTTAATPGYARAGVEQTDGGTFACRAEKGT